MLVLHPSSRCDVCLSEYVLENPRLRPHAISCGHIFCMGCLLENRPPLCPLCRKEYQPNKMKKLHVDRPEEIDDHKELDLLQRLAISWEIPEDQLKELTTEVDSWLSNRSDDSCVALRKARAALTRHRELKDAEQTLDDFLRRLERANEKNGTLQRDVDKFYAAYEASQAMLDKLTKENNSLKVQNEALQANTQRYTHTQGHNPLPRPPEPIPTDKVPSFEQAVSHSGTVRFASLPVSPRSTVGTPYPFEVEKRRHRKGKSRTDERGHYDDSLRYTSTSTSSSPALPESSHHSHHRASPSASHQSYDHYSSPKQTTRTNGLQVHFDNTAQPLDPFSLTQAYLREYSSGFINGQEAALGQRMTDFPPASQTPVAGQSASSRHRTQPTSASVVEPNQRYSSSSSDIYAYPAPYSAPVTNERSPRPGHRRQATATSIISSSTSSIHNDRPSSRSRSRSRASEPSSAIGSPQYSNPMLASILSDSSQSSRQQSLEPVSPQPRYAASPNILSPTMPSQQAQPPPPPTQHRPPLSSTSSITSNSVHSAADPTNFNPNSRTSPSARSRMSLQSGETWGTPTPSHLTAGSLIDGLMAFRMGAEPVLVDGQPSMSFHELGSDGASVRTREMSFSDLSSEHGGGNNVNAHVSSSPVRAVQSMVGVLPAEREAQLTGSSHRSSRRDERDRSSSYSHRSATAFETRSHQDRNVWDTTAGVDAGHRRPQYSSASSVASEPRNYYSSYQQETSYRSPPSSSTHQRGYDEWGSRDPYHQRTQSHASLSSRGHTNAYDDRERDRERRHQQQARFTDDNASVTSSLTSSSHSSRRQPPPLPRGSHLSLSSSSGSPFPVSVEYAEYAEESRLRAPSRDTDRSGSRSGSGSNASTIRGVPAGFGNALGLQLSTSDLGGLEDGTSTINAPTPVASSRSFLRSWSRDHYES